MAGMRWRALAGTLVTACSTAPLDGQSGSFDTFASVSESATDGSTGTPGTSGSEGTSGDPSDPTVDPDSTAGPTTAESTDPTDPTDATTGESSSGNVEESTGMTSMVEESSSSGMMESGMMESTGGPDPLACIDGDLGEAVGDAVASGSTAGGVDDLTISCAGGGGADAVYLWTAPAADSYTFDLSGSSYDTAIALFDPDCDGAEIACNDDAIGLTSSLTLDLAADEQVLVVIDGFNGATGNYVLDINTGPALDFSCADGGDLGSATGDVAMGTTAGADDSWDASCATDGPDVTYAWTAPAAASYTFSLAGSSYDTLLTLQSPDCAGSQLACNDDAVGLQSELSVALAAGETVLVVVDGYNNNSGAFTLSIN